MTQREGDRGSVRSLMSLTPVGVGDVISAISRLPAADPLPVSVMTLVADETVLLFRLNRSTRQHALIFPPA